MRNNDLLAESIPEMRSCIERAKICIDELQRGFYSPGTVNSFIDAAMQKMEKACIDLRNISEKLRRFFFKLSVKSKLRYKKAR